MSVLGHAHEKPTTQLKLPNIFYIYFQKYIFYVYVYNIYIKCIDIEMYAMYFVHAKNIL